MDCDGAQVEHSRSLVVAAPVATVFWIGLTGGRLCGAQLLKKGDNEPTLFWRYVLTALDSQQPGLCTQLVTYLHTQQTPPLRSVLQALINRLAEQSEQFLLFLDDYYLLTEQSIHTSLTYLVEHLPPHLHLILATRADPPLPLSLLRARGHLLEVRSDALRCTPEEVIAFLKQTVSIQLPHDVVEAVATRTEGWLVGLQLLGLSLQGHGSPGDLLQKECRLCPAERGSLLYLYLLIGRGDSLHAGFF